MFTSRYVDTGELRLHAVTGGGGPPLLLVHGWPQTWYAWRMVSPGSGLLWVIAALRARHRAVGQASGAGTTPAPSRATWPRSMDALGHQRFAGMQTDVGMP